MYTIRLSSITTVALDFGSGFTQSITLQLVSIKRKGFTSCQMID
jgi:hypothetical protein